MSVTAVIVYFFLCLSIFFWLIGTICGPCNGLYTMPCFYCNMAVLSAVWPITVVSLLGLGMLPFAIGRRPPRTMRQISEMFATEDNESIAIAYALKYKQIREMFVVEDEPIARRTRSHTSAK